MTLQRIEGGEPLSYNSEEPQENGRLGFHKVSEVDYQSAGIANAVTGIFIALFAAGTIIGAFFWGYGDLVLQNPTWILAGQVTFGVCISLLAVNVIVACRS